jgi:hypothetical protein
MLCQRWSGLHHFKGTMFLWHIRTTSLVTQHHISEDLNPQNHCCENPETHTLRKTRTKYWFTTYDYNTRVLRHIPILQSLAPQTFHTLVWNQPSYNIQLHSFNRYVTILTTTLPNIKLFVYYRIIFIIYFYYRVHTNCKEQHKHTTFYLF